MSDDDTGPDEDRVAFNCVVPRSLRRRIRMIAADRDVQIGQVCVEALRFYLEHHPTGSPAPASTEAA